MGNGVSLNGGASGTKDAAGVRLQRQHRPRQPAGVSDSTGLGDHLAMPEMHAVEVPDSHGRAAHVGRQVLEMAKHAHE